MPQTVPLRTLNRHIRQDRQEVESVLCKVPGAPRAHEPAAIILLVRIRIDHPCLDDTDLPDAHTLTILRSPPWNSCLPPPSLLRLLEDR